MSAGRRAARALVLWGVTAIVSAACTAPPTAPPTTPPTAPPTTPPPTVPPTAPPITIPEDVKQLSELVGYYSRVAAMPPDDQRREYTSASQSFTRDPSPYNRIRVALLALMPGTPFQDEVRAMSLLEPYSRSGPSYDKLRQFGAILHGQLAETTTARGRAEQLQEQLEALRAVERTIIERGQSAPPTKR